MPKTKEVKKIEIIPEFKIGKLTPYPSTKKVKTREQSITNALESARKYKKVKK